MTKNARPLLATLALVVALFGGLAGVSQLRFASVLSDSVNERLEVVAKAAAQDLSSALDLGLSLNQVANGPAILQRASRHDPRITSMYVVDISGSIIHATAAAPEAMDTSSNEAFSLAVQGIGGSSWAAETKETISSGIVIEGSFGTPVGAVVVEYPAAELRAQTRRIANDLALLGAIVAALVALVVAAVWWSVLRRRATEDDAGVAPTVDSQPHRSKAVPIVLSGVLVAGVVTFGALAIPKFNAALSPELERRAGLIGETISDDTARALEIGIPLSRLVGVEEYFGVFFDEFPEINHLAIRATAESTAYASNRGGGIGVEQGSARSDIYSFGVSDGRDIRATVDVGVDPDFVASKLRELALDMIVVLIVALVIMFEFSRASMRGFGARSDSTPGAADAAALSTIRIVLFLFAVGEELNKSFLPLFIKGAHNPIPAISSSVAISLPIAAYLLAIAVASPFAGRLRGVFGTRNLFLVGVAPAALSHLGMIYADNVVQIIGLRALTGIGYALATIACLELILDKLPRGMRARGIGAFVAVVIGGTFTGTALGGIIADRRGYTTVFIVSFGLVVIAAILAYRMIPKSAATTTGSSSSISLTDMWRVLRQRDLMLLMAGVTVPMNVVTAAFLWYLVPLVLASVGATSSATARTLMVYYLVILVGSPIAARAAGRIKNWALVGVGSVLSGVILLIPARSSTELTVLFAVLVVGIGHTAVRGPQIDLALSIAETEMPEAGREPTLAAMRTLERLGSLVGLLVVAVLAARFGLGTAMASIGVAGAIAGSLYLVFRRSPVRELVDA